MGRTDLKKIENRAGGKDADKKMPYAFSLDVKLRKPEDAQQIGDAAPAAKVAAAPAAPGDAKPPADLGAQLDSAATTLMNKPAPPAAGSATAAAAPAPAAPPPATPPATGDKK